MSNATNQEAAFEDEIVAWLQYPLEDMLEKSYCSDAPGQWSLSTPLPPMPSETIPHAVHVKPLSHEPSLFMGRSTSAETAHTKSLLQMKKLTSSKESIYLGSSNAEDALALGAHRAAGLSSQVGQEEFARVRTSVQPQASNLHGHQHSLSSMASKGKDHLRVLKQQGLDASEEHDRSVRVKLAGSPCTPTSVGSGKRCSQREPSQAAFQLSASAAISGLSRITQEKLSSRGKGPACSMQLTSASMPPSSTFSDAESKGWQKVVDVGQRQATAKGPALCSRDAFVTSMDLSCRDVRYGGKRRKLDTSDQLSEMSEEDGDDDLVEMKLPHKFSLSKRNRVPEAHNLSERNRRNRINEKLRVLQELIPNSSKTDKASVLDEAIEYMKTLQMQLQMLSMRNSMGMPPLMMIPVGLPQSHLHVAPLQQVGIGIPVGHAGTLSMGVAGLGAGMVDMGFPVVGTPPARPIQSAAVLENGIPFHSGKAVGSMEGHSQLGYGPLESLPKVTRALNKSQYNMHGGSEYQPYAHPCPGHEQYQKHGQNSPKQDR